MEREALKLALEALERINPRFAEDVMRQHDAVTAIREALAQPAQEPVRECNSIDCQYIDGLGKTDCDWCRPKKAPPQRPWVDLTDEDIHNTVGYNETREMYQFALALIAKLKDKNGA